MPGKNGKDAPAPPPRHIEYVALGDAVPATRNAKTHDVPWIKSLIAKFGFVGSAIHDGRTGKFIAGHGRLESLEEMAAEGQEPPDGIMMGHGGVWLMPVEYGWSSRSDAEAEALAIALNESTTRGGWDERQLTAMLADLDTVDADLRRLAGWDDGTFGALLESLGPAGGPGGDPDPDGDGGDLDEVPAPPAEPVTRPGDLWLLGPHRLLCGDATGDLSSLFPPGGNLATLVFTSPPYASQRKYDPASGFRPVPPDEYGAWFAGVSRAVWSSLRDDGSFLLNIKEHSEGHERHLYVKRLVVELREAHGWRFIDEFCWVDTGNGLPGAWPNRLKDAWEPVFHFAKRSTGLVFHPTANAVESSRTFHYTNETRFALRPHGIERHDALTEESGIARASNVLHIQAHVRGRLHSAPFPVALPAWFIRLLTNPGDVVFDPFAGSGTTLIAAHGEGRVGYGVEISPAYCDTTCRRWQEKTGELPVLASTGEPHDFTAVPAAAAHTGGAL